MCGGRRAGWLTHRLRESALEMTSRTVRLGLGRIFLAKDNLYDLLKGFQFPPCFFGII